MDTITESITHCIEYAQSIRSGHTARAYQMGLSHFSDYLRTLKIDPDQEPCNTVTMAHFAQFPAYLAGRGYSKKTVNVYLSGTQFYLYRLVSDYVIDPSYSESIRQKDSYRMARSKREFKLPRTPQRGAVEKIIAAARSMSWSDNEGMNELLHHRNYALILFLASTGCRNNEVATLKIKSIDLEDHSAVVMGKCSKERRVFFSEDAAFALEEYWKIRGFRGVNNYAFSPHAKNTKPTDKLTTKSVRTIVEAAADAAGLERGTFTPHYFRHAFAIKMLNKTGNLALVQDLMGHSDPAATRVYAKIYPEDLHKAHKEVYG